MTIFSPGSARKSPAFFHVDTDGFWTMREFYALKPVIDPQEIFEIAIPRFLDLFASCGVKATFFIIAKDLENPSHRRMAERILEDGHQIANHTYSHPFGLALLPKSEIKREIESAHEAIQRILGVEPVGFRAPGYNVDSEVLEILREMGYRYDSSVFPSFINPLYHIAHRILAHGTDLPNSDLGGLNTMRCPTEPYQPNHLHFWQRDSGRNVDGLWEFPVGVIPYLKLPMHANFLLLMPRLYLQIALSLAASQPHTFLFHTVELLECDEIPPELKRHPNTGLSLATKRDCCGMYVAEIKKRFDVHTTEEYLLDQKGSSKPVLDMPVKACQPPVSV